MNYVSMCETVQRGRVLDPDGQLRATLGGIGFRVDADADGLAISADEQCDMWYPDASTGQDGFVPELIRASLLPGEVMVVREIAFGGNGGELDAAVYVITPEQVVGDNLASITEKLLECLPTPQPPVRAREACILEGGTHSAR